MNRVFNKKMIHTYIVLIAILIVAVVVGLIMLRYSIQGERTMPFTINQMHIISTATTMAGSEQVDEYGQWHMDLIQKNEIYLYIAANPEYRRDEAISSVILDNFRIEKYNEAGQVQLYRQYDIGVHNFAEEFLVEDRLEITGNVITDVRALEINNQGGVIGLGVIIRDIARYNLVQGERAQINGITLAEEGVTAEDIKVTIYFDITIEIVSGNRFRAQHRIELPVGNILENGLEHVIVEDLSGMVFRRI